jgi:hypothetical protein
MEETAMPGLRYDTLVNRPDEVLAFTSLTLDEFDQLLPDFENAFQNHMRQWRLDGKPRIARSYVTYANCPLPSPADRLLFILAYLKTYSLQVVHGRLFGMSQSKANQWIHTLLPVMQATLQSLGDAPARTIQELALRLQIAIEDAQAQVDSIVVEAAALSRQDDDDASEPCASEAAHPLFVTMAQNDRSCARTTHLNRRSVIAARSAVTRSRT